MGVIGPKSRGLYPCTRRNWRLSEFSTEVFHLRREGLRKTGEKKLVNLAQQLPRASSKRANCPGSKRLPPMPNHDHFARVVVDRTVRRPMSKKFQIRESRRYTFQAPVEIRWVDAANQSHLVRGASHDVSIFGLGISVPRLIPADQEVTVMLNGVEVCGGAIVRHSQPCESGFRVGLYFRLTLLMQNVPELDELLDPAQPPRTAGQSSVVPALLRRFALRLWRLLVSKTNTTLPQASCVKRATVPNRQ